MNHKDQPRVWLSSNRKFIKKKFTDKLDLDQHKYEKLNNIQAMKHGKKSCNVAFLSCYSTTKNFICP